MTYELPEEFAELWAWFRRLQQTSQNGMGKTAINEVQMEAFFRNRRIRPALWQIEVIVWLDNLSRQKDEDEQ